MVMKKCPYCAGEIPEEAVKCSHCLTWLTSPPGQSSSSPLGSSPQPASPRRLQRSSSSRMLAGVCGGIGNYMGLDPTVVRILYALITFFTAIIPGILVYLILVLIIPLDEGSPS